MRQETYTKHILYPQGDSGGPLVYNDNGNYVEIGVESWDIGCAIPGHPGVYSRVNSKL